MIAGEEFGIPIDKVMQIIMPQKITPLPKVPSFINGVINLRGLVIPLMDLRKRLGVEFSSLKEKILIIKINGEKMGLLVDDVREIVNIEKEHVVNPPTIFKGLKPEYLLSIVKINDRLIVILNLNNLLTSEEKILLEESKEAFLTGGLMKNAPQENKRGQSFD
jgi:purine-binding chemotaxis protein CheW